MLGKLLGKGSDGEVYEILKDNTHVVKYIQPKICGIENYLEYFLLLNINHPNIVNAEEIELTQHNLVKIVQKRAKSNLCRKNKNKKAIFRQIIEGVKFLNCHNILHGDIKPSNILVFENEQVKINDMSLCRFIDSKSDKQMYTYHYRPPEIDRGEKHINSDIYALGCTLYEIYFNESYHDKRCNTKIHLPKSKNTLNEDLLDLIYNMTKNNPNDRYSINDVCSHKYFSKVKFKDYSCIKLDNYKILENLASNLNLNDIFVKKCMNENLDICKNYKEVDIYVTNVLKFNIFDYIFENDFFKT